jgi:LacI family transcriptional regulator
VGESEVTRGKWDILFALAESHGLSIVEIPISAPTVEGGAGALRRIVASGATAVMAYNDLVAHGVLRAAHTSGIRIPEEFSLVGFDDIFSAELTVPQLTTLRVPVHEIGATAMRLLLDPGANREPSWQSLPIEFIVRESTAPPRPR